MKSRKDSRKTRSAIIRALRSGVPLAHILAGAVAMNGCRDQGFFSPVGSVPYQGETNGINEFESYGLAGEIADPEDEKPVIVKPHEPQGLSEDDYIRFVISHDTKFLGVDLYPIGSIYWGPDSSLSSCRALTTGIGCTLHRRLERTVMLAHPIAGTRTATLSSKWDDFTNYSSLEIGDPKDRTLDRPFDLDAERRWVLAVAREIRDVAWIPMALLSDGKTGVSAYGESGAFSVCVSSFPCKRSQYTSGTNGQKEKSWEAVSRSIVIRPLFWCKREADQKPKPSRPTEAEVEVDI